MDHGDTVLVPNRSYPIHIYGAVIAGCRYSVPLVEAVDFFKSNWSAPFAKVIRNRR
ncbi:hypothetical protein ACLB1R_03245 [Escherichia coli]